MDLISALKNIEFRTDETIVKEILKSLNSDSVPVPENAIIEFNKNYELNKFTIFNSPEELSEYHYKTDFNGPKFLIKGGTKVIELVGAEGFYSFNKQNNLFKIKNFRKTNITSLGTRGRILGNSQSIQ